MDGIDILFLCLGSCSALLVALGLIGPVQGSTGAGVVFSWHPILMGVAFPCLMVLGRWSYISKTLGDKASQRSVHRAFMSAAAVAAIAGYVCIFLSHLPAKKFFGYDFGNKTWGVPSRVAHSLLGYVVLLLVLAQACMGLAKAAGLDRGERIFTFHGQLGKAIMLLALTVILLACVFWGWSLPFKLAVAACTASAMLCGMFWPSHIHAQGDPERVPLQEPKAE
eukprot:TRINITY_DN27595_c0_g1_i2.p1 TRINITY_DN27595_c0_g1~~TRINITY_DN27595_c0_g1_i2.p1  ORF type:complete len:223 (-),score=29.22 TRINITY_DN27595_c0_g1_i2:127-795(-)